MKNSIDSSATTRVYNLISVSQITRTLLGDVIISSKTDPRDSSSKTGKRSYGNLFEFFILNDKAIVCDATTVHNLKKVYLGISFSVLYFAARYS